MTNMQPPPLPQLSCCNDGLENGTRRGRVSLEKPRICYYARHMFSVQNVAALAGRGQTMGPSSLDHERRVSLAGRLGSSLWRRVMDHLVSKGCAIHAHNTPTRLASSHGTRKIPRILNPIINRIGSPGTSITTWAEGASGRWTDLPRHVSIGSSDES
jgi:hypothetical protein